MRHFRPTKSPISGTFFGLTKSPIQINFDASLSFEKKCANFVNLKKNAKAAFWNFFESYEIVTQMGWQKGCSGLPELSRGGGSIGLPGLQVSEMDWKPSNEFHANGIDN